MEEKLTEIFDDLDTSSENSDFFVPSIKKSQAAVGDGIMSRDDSLKKKNVTKKEGYDEIFVEIEPEVLLIDIADSAGESSSDADEAIKRRQATLPNDTVKPCKSGPKVGLLKPNISGGENLESNGDAFEGDSSGVGKVSGEIGDQVQLKGPRRSTSRTSKHYNPFELIDDGVVDENTFHDGEDDQDGEESLVQKENIVIGSSAGGETFVKCGKCDSLVLETNLDRHLATHVEIYPCQFCKHKAHNPTDAKQHFRSHRRSFLKPDGSYMCKLCDKAFDSLQGVYKHHQITHAPDVRCALDECNKIFRGFKAYKLLRMHYQHCHAEILGKENAKVYKCNVCSKKFKTASLKCAHEQRKHKKEKHFFECAPCGFKFPQRFHLLRHLSSNSHQKKVTKMISVEANESIETLSPYQVSMTGPKEGGNKCAHHQPSQDKKASSGLCDICGFICTGCLKVFETYLRAQQHKHKYVCNKCGKMCPTKQDFGLHQDFHNEGTKWHCQVCEFGFTSFRPYQYHMKIHGQSFVKNTAVAAINACPEQEDAQRCSPPKEVVHSHKCPMCDLKFSSRQHLFLHRFLSHFRQTKDNSEGQKIQPGVVEKL